MADQLSTTVILLRSLPPSTRITSTSPLWSSCSMKGLSLNAIQIQVTGNDITLVPLREEVVTSLSGGGWHTPGLGGARLQARGERSVRTLVLSLIDLAGLEKAVTSDKERTREFLVLYQLSLSLLDGPKTGITYPTATRSNTYSETFLVRYLTHLNAQNKETVDTGTLVERYRNEIEDLKRSLAEREADAPIRNCRLPARERLVSPAKVDFDIHPYQLQQELLAARMKAIESQASQLLSLEAALVAHSLLPTTASESEKDELIVEQGKREFEIFVRGYKENLGDPLQKVEEDVEREWKEKFDEKATKQFGECRTLAAFVTIFNVLGPGLGAAPVSKLQPRILPCASNYFYADGKLSPFPAQASLLNHELEWLDRQTSFDYECYFAPTAYVWDPAEWNALSIWIWLQSE
ncbi:hypothetical protein BDQ17DRAFT_1337743 [Cyathus striatus]|nr:hypothetical protein BDQ17DRAFT_1337743 [Cyathus striatus]